MSKRVAIYVRTSVGQLSAANTHVDHLRAVADRLGWSVVAAHTDHGGPDGKRAKGLDAVRHAIAAGDIDVLMLPSLTVIGATVEQVVSFIAELQTAGGVSLYIDDAGINTTIVDDMGLFAVVRLLDAYKRSIRRQRILEGQARAKAVGIKFGRPRISDDKIRRVRKALEAGNGIRASGRASGVSAAAVLRIKRQMIGSQDSAETVTP